MTSRYTVEKGESAQDVARKFTGDPSRYRDLIPMNPHLQTVVGTLGAPEFHPHDWHDGMSLFLPERWVDTGQIHGSMGAPMMPVVHSAGSLTATEALWGDRHPQWAGSWLAYWSMRVGAVVGATFGVQNPNVNSWLKQWSSPHRFENAMLGPYHCVATIPGDLWFASSMDRKVAACAAVKYMQPTSDQSTGNKISRGANTPGPTFGVGSPGNVGCGCSRPEAFQITPSTLAQPADTPFTRRLKQMYPNVYGKKKYDPNQYKLMTQWKYGVGAPSGTGTMGDPGDPCSVGAITDVMPYYYKVQAGDSSPEHVAKTWLGSAWSVGTGPHTTRALLKANHDKSGGFIEYSYGCNFKYFNPGDIIKIPASWPPPPKVYEKWIVNIDGTTYVPKGDEPKNDVPGADGTDRVNWFGGGAGSNTMLMVLAAALAVGGGIILHNSMKKKRAAAAK